LEDAKKALDRLQQELLSEESDRLDALLEDFLEEPMPAFEDPDATAISDQKVDYCNYANDYGSQSRKPVQTRMANRKKKKDDRTIVALMVIASLECVGILGVLIYWLRILL